MKTINLIRYIINEYPHKDELSEARLNKIIYLVDWKSAIDKGEKITNIDWMFNHDGPYVIEIENLIAEDDRFNIVSTRNIYGNEKNLITLKEDKNFPEPNENDRKIIDFVIDKTRKFNWKEFIELVYSTYPIISQERGTTLDLVALANEYNTIKEKAE